MIKIDTTVGFVLLAGICLLLMYWVPYVSAFIALVLGIGLLCMIQLVAWIDQLPGAVAYGFQYHWIWVIVMYAILAFWVFQLHKKWLKYARISLLVLIVLSISTIRYLNQESGEFIVFNDSDAYFAIKSESAIIGFYDLEKGRKDRLESLLTDYQKSYPGKIQIRGIDIGETHLKLSGRKVKITRDDEMLRVIGIDSKNYLFRIGWNGEKKQNDFLISPWKNETEADYCLANGALRVSF